MTELSSLSSFRCARGLRPPLTLGGRDVVHAVGAGKSFLAARRPRHETACQMRERSSAGAINARKEILSVRSKYTRAYVDRCTLRLSATGPLRPIRDDRKRNTAEFPVRMHRASPSPSLCIRRGTSRQASLTEKTHSFSQQRSRKQKAVARGAPRPARKNIIYVRRNGGPIARRFKPHGPPTLLFFPVLPDV